MNMSSLLSRFAKKIVAVSLILPVLGFLFPLSPAQADTLTQLQQQEAALQQQAQQAQQQALQNQTIAQRAAATIQQVSGQINDLQSSIFITQNNISSTQTQIAGMDQQLAQLQSQLGDVQDKENKMLRELYILEVSQGGQLQYFSDQSISEQQRQQQQSQSLEKYLTGLYNQLVSTRQQVTSDRQALVDKSQELATLQSQQQDQQSTLADAKATQQNLQRNAIATETQLEAQAAAAQKQASQIGQKIALLTATKNWGGQIVSAYQPSWYYTQTGDNTRLGSSYETVNNVGCLITSIAMVDTFYGQRVSPDYMATHASFSSGGSYYWGTPSGLGVSLHPSGGVNWSVVESQVASGHPVIISMYLPSVGAINSDGSSHFIVVYGFEGGKFLMQDPIAPTGRGYDEKYARSMILTTPN